MVEVVRSVNGVPIQLTDERWAHVLGNRPEYVSRLSEILDTVARPDVVLEGARGESLAVREVLGGHHLLVVYREVAPQDGFIITAYETSKRLRRPGIWQSQN